MKQRDLIKMLEDAGYTLIRDTGNHMIFSNPGHRNIPVPRHKEIKENLAKAILKQAGIK